jgi:hypothetical protein
MSSYTTEKIYSAIKSLINDAEEHYGKLYEDNIDKIKTEIIKDIQEELHIKFEEAKQLYELLKFD